MQTQESVTLAQENVLHSNNNKDPSSTILSTDDDSIIITEPPEISGQPRTSITNKKLDDFDQIETEVQDW